MMTDEFSYLWWQNNQLIMFKANQKKTKRNKEKKRGNLTSRQSDMTHQWPVLLNIIPEK
jgi:hypothetical protein